MDFRRIPFQFSTTDPLKRQEELQRRFGLPANKGNMHVDFPNPGAMGMQSDTNSASSSPRLQHRVPIFVEGQSEPTKPSVDAQNVDSGRKPHVRVIPIEIEGEDNNKKHRWLSGSSEPLKARFNGESIPVETVKHPVQDPSSPFQKTPRVCNIPIKIEGSDHVARPKSPVNPQKVKTPESPKNTGVKLNGCSATKVAKVNEEGESPKVQKIKESLEQIILKKIQKIEEKLKGYHADVEKFSGTNKEKQYRYLDEMLTRCMLELDEIDTMRLDAIRLARKVAVKKVQASLDLLESKIIKEDKPDLKNEAMEVETSADQSTDKDADIKVEGAELENISIMETEEAISKSEGKEPVPNSDNSISKPIVTDKNVGHYAIQTHIVDKVTEPVQITEVGTDTVAFEVEPLVEEPLSDSKEEDSIDVDLDDCNCKSSSVQICELENDSVSNHELKTDTNEQLDENLEMEVTEISDVPLVTEVKTNQGIDTINELTVPEQSAVSIDSNSDSANM